MGMRVSSTAGTSQSGAAAWQQRQQDFQALAQALKTNDLTGAKAAYASLTGSGSSSASSNPNSPLAQLGQALQNGDLGAAQQALSALRSGHHHSGTASNLPAPAAPTATSGNNVNFVV